MSVPTVVLCGLGGYGEHYAEPLFEAEARGECRVVAAVDPHPEGCSKIARWRERRTPIHPTLEAFYARDGRCDLVILVLPIGLHCSQTRLALERGSHVLCEKPLCASMEEAEAMRAAERRSGKTVTIGYQWSFSPAIGALKEDVLAGRLGAPLRLRTLVCWPRPDKYYARNRWAGAQRTGEGVPIFDSPVNNAAAHYLHNMLYLLGPSARESARAERVEAELWRARPIENYDTAALRIAVAGHPGAELLFYASHAVEAERGPVLSYEFERATVRHEGYGSPIVAEFHDGGTVDYGAPDAEPFRKISEALLSARTGRPPRCGIAAAAAHTRCMLLAQASPDGIRDFPRSLLRTVSRDGDSWRHVEGLDRLLAEAYAEGKTLREIESLHAAPSAT